MPIQTLTPPQDITWKRMAFSRDMIDTNFGDMAFPPKWRTSLTIYYYIVPEEEVVDAYPDSRIVYLKLSCSITGWNPNEELTDIRQLDEAGDNSDDFQNSVWEAIEASGWASKYWGCHGAIMQLGIFPSKDDNVSAEDFPYIMDFEPKKRELYEAVTSQDAVLSGSSNKVSTTKGSTHTISVEAKVGGGVSIPFVSSAQAELTTGYQYQHQSVDTTDSLQEDRTTKSNSTSFSQMYQLFNGYHLGTNRAVFVVSPRPHSKTGSFNLINGERTLEGIQDVFLVVTMPKSLKGFCVHASIDTGHKNPDEYIAENSMSRTIRMAQGEFGDPPCMGSEIGPGFDPGGGGGGGGGGTGGGGGGDDNSDPRGFSLIVTRRTVQSCGVFDENGLFKIQKSTSAPKPPHYFVGETFLPVKNIGNKLLSSRARLGAPEGGFDDCYEYTARTYNYNLSRMAKSMVEIFSSGKFKPQSSFKDTNTFKTLFAHAVKKTGYSIDSLHKLKYLTEKEFNALKKYKVETVSDLFKASAENIMDVDINVIRKKIIKEIKR